MNPWSGLGWAPGAPNNPGAGGLAPGGGHSLTPAGPVPGVLTWREGRGEGGQVSWGGRPDASAPTPRAGFTPSEGLPGELLEGTLGGCRGVASVRRGHRRARTWVMGSGRSGGRCGSLRAEFGDWEAAGTSCRGRAGGSGGPPVGVHGAAGGEQRRGTRRRRKMEGECCRRQALFPQAPPSPSGGPSRGPQGATPLCPGPLGSVLPVRCDPGRQS